LPVKKIASGLLALLGGFGLLALILDGLNNAHILTWGISLFGTITLIFSFLVINFVLKRDPLSWGKFRVTKLKYLPKCFITGIIILLWYPHLGVLTDFARTSLSSAPAQSPASNPANETSSNSKIKILVAKFQGPDVDGLGIADHIRREIKTLTAGNEIAVEKLDQEIETKSEAQQAGLERGAFLVLWGVYYASSTTGKIESHFELINLKECKAIIKNEDTLFVKAEELKGFTIHDDLANKLANVALFSVGLLRLEERDYSKAVETFEKVAESGVDTNDHLAPQYARYFTGFVYSLMKDKSAEAILNYDKAISINKSFVQAYYSKAQVYASLDQTEKALSILKEARAIDFKNPSLYVTFCAVYIGSRKFMEAAENCEIALGFDPENISALVNRGVIHLELNELDKAKKLFQKAFELDKKMTAIHINLSNVLALENKIPEAISLLEQAIKIDPQESHAYISLGNNLTTLWFKTKDKAIFDKALDNLNKGLKLNPLHINGLLIRAELLCEKDPVSAFMDAQLAGQLQPNRKEAYYLKGKILYKAKKYIDAIWQLTTAINLDTSYERALLERSAVFSEIKDHKAAILDCQQIQRFTTDAKTKDLMARCVEEESSCKVNHQVYNVGGKTRSSFR
jgi:tetratricopeptide (TPR) repeat protein